MKSSVKKNLMYQTFYEIIVIILPLLTSPYISRILGAKNLGIFSYTYSIAYYFQLFGMLGMKFYGNRKIAQVRDNKDELERTYSELLTIHIIISLVSCILYIGYIRLSDYELRIFALIQGFMVVSTIFDISWFFFGIENFKINVTRNAVIKVLSVICIFLFVKERTDFWKYVLIMATSQAAGQSILFLIVPKYVKYRLPNFRDLGKHIMPLLVLFIPVISTSLFKYMDKIMLGALGNKIELGLYDNAEKILNIPLSVIFAFGSVMLPKISNLIANQNTKQCDKYMKVSIRYMGGLSIAMAFGMSGIANIFAPIFWGKDFSKCAELITILAISLPFTTLANIVRNQDLVPNNKDKQYTCAIVIGASVNLLVNWLLIPRFQAYGVSLGTLIAEISVCFVQIIFVNKDFHYREYIGKALWFTIPGIVMYVIVLCIGIRLGVHIYTLFIQICVGVVVFGSISFIHLIRIKDEEFLGFLNRIKKVKR